MFREFPKYVTLPGGGSAIVKDRAEEMQLLGIEAPKNLPVAEEDCYNNAPVDYESDELLPCDIPVAAEEVEEIIQDDALPLPDTKEKLQDEADTLGVIYDKRWGIDKLLEAINTAKVQAAQTVTI